MKVAARGQRTVFVGEYWPGISDNA